MSCVSIESTSKFEMVDLFASVKLYPAMFVPLSLIASQFVTKCLRFRVFPRDARHDRLIHHFVSFSKVKRRLRGTVREIYGENSFGISSNLSTKIDWLICHGFIKVDRSMARIKSEIGRPNLHYFERWLAFCVLASMSHCYLLNIHAIRMLWLRPLILLWSILLN